MVRVHTYAELRQQSRQSAVAGCAKPVLGHLLSSHRRYTCRKLWPYGSKATVRASVAATIVPEELSNGTQNTTQAAESAVETSSVSKRRQQFNWFQQWYPVASLDAIDSCRPHPFTLLGQNLVLWRDGSGSWRAFKDACPHRLAPLSEGRVEKDGTLLCAYHGWRFNGEGACTALPYCRADDPAYRSPRSCAVSYPTLERGGLVWVWGEGGPGAVEAAAGKQPPLPPEIQEDGSLAPGVSNLGWTHRDLPYSFTYFVENVIDPAHVPVSHHNIAGNRYTDPKPFRMELSRPVTMEGGFKVSLPDSYSPTIANSYVEFVPPCLVRIQSNNRDGSRTVLSLFSTPVRPGLNRLVGNQFTVRPSDQQSGGGKSLVGFVGADLPKWLVHLLGPLFLHQDQVFLHYQERAVAREQRERLRRQGQQSRGLTEAGSAAAEEGKPYDGGDDGSVPLPNYYCPGQADRGVAAWRSWLATYSGGDVTYVPGTPPLDADGPSDRSKLFDIWNSHTSHCTICLGTLARLKVVRGAAVAVGIAAAVTVFAAVVAKAVAANVASAAAAAAAGAAGGGAPSVGAAAASGGLVPVLQAASLVLSDWHGLAAVIVALLAAAVVVITQRMQEMLHTYHFSHADNH